MIQVITHCDRCRKVLDNTEGYSFQIWGRDPWRQPTQRSPLAAPLSHDMCDGCYQMLDFFFVGRFKEEPANA